MNNIITAEHAHVTDRFLFICRLKINHESHWANAFILEFSTVANNNIRCVTLSIIPRITGEINPVLT
jgi:hypothetical protein